MATFYKPKDGYLADCMPLFYDNTFYIFYLKDYHDKENYPEGVSWNLVCTKDFIQFEDKGEVLIHGEKDQQDLYLYTGCVLQCGEMFHMFYVSHNPYFPMQGKARQGICHAISKNLIDWERCPEDNFFSPGNEFEMDDWRDPFVFWNEKENKYWMLFAAKKGFGPAKGRGITALATSEDLKKWDICEPVYDSGRYIVPECPELFQMGEWWYLIFSEFSDEFMTRYRMSKTPSGPWMEPEKDTFDDRAFYAAKTCVSHGKRYLMGWNPTRKGHSDYGDWEWGGALVVHQLVQNDDGTLCVLPVNGIVSQFTERLSSTFIGAYRGEIIQEENALIIDGTSSLATAKLGNMPAKGVIELDYETLENKGGFGLWIHGSEDFNEGYYFRVEPYRQRVVVDMWPRDQIADPTQIAGRDTNPYKPGLYQLVDTAACKNGRMLFLFDDSIGVLYLSDGTALSCRMFSLKGDNWGVFARNSKVKFTNMKIMTTNEKTKFNKIKEDKK